MTRRRERARHLFLLPTVDVVEADAADRGGAHAGSRGRHGGRQSGRASSTRPAARRSRDAHVEVTRNVVAACKAAGVRAPAAHERAQRRSGGAQPLSAQQGRGRGDSSSASGLAWTIFQPSVIFGREDSFLNLFAQPVARAAGAGARRRRTRGSSRSTSATSRTASSHALDRRRDDRPALPRCAARRSTRCASSCATSATIDRRAAADR